MVVKISQKTNKCGVSIKGHGVGKIVLEMIDVEARLLEIQEYYSILSSSYVHVERKPER